MDRPNSSSTTLRSRTSSFTRKLKDYNVQLKDDETITWDPKSTQHPRNWSAFAKTDLSALIYWLEFLMTAVSSAGTAAAESASEEYGMSKTLSYFAFVSIYLIGQTVGGIFCSPISEFFGRRTIYIIGTSLFAVCSIIVAAPPNVIAVYVGRFFQGLAAAIPATVAFGNFEDMFDAHDRVWVVYGYTLAGVSGLVVGPIYSVYVTQSIGWRWVFYISAIASGASVIWCAFMKESNADQLLQTKVDKLREQTGEDSLTAENSEDHQISISSFLQNALYRPLQMLVMEPLVFFCAALCGVAFALIYGLTEGLNIVYTAPPFNFSDTSASLSFIAIFIGLVLDALPRFYDQHLLKREHRLGHRILPETKIRSFAVACPALAIGLWIFAWTIPPRVPNLPWPISMIGLIGVGFAANDFSYILFGYVTDSYGKNAASAAGAVSMTRTLMAAAFPLFTSQMFTGLGSNIAVTILASVATAFCFTPWLFLQYGHKLRRRSKMAANDEDCMTKENKHLNEETGEESKEPSD